MLGTLSCQDVPRQICNRKFDVSDLATGGLVAFARSEQNLDELRSVIDRQQITDQIYRYCRAMDRTDRNLGYSIWYEDGTADYGHNFQGTGHAFIDHVCDSTPGLLQHSHQVSNVIIEIDGDRAGSESYVTATLSVMRDGRLQQMIVISRYVDAWSRRDGCWAIDHRVAVLEKDEIREVNPMMAHDHARRDTTDLSYAVLESRP